MQRNVKELIDANGVRTLVELLTVAHLHISRATVPMQVTTKDFLFLGGLVACWPAPIHAVAPPAYTVLT